MCMHPEIIQSGRDRLSRSKWKVPWLWDFECGYECREDLLVVLSLDDFF